MKKGHYHYELGTLQGRGKRHQGQTIGNRLAEGQGERAERVRARLKVMQEIVMAIQVVGQ